MPPEHMLPKHDFTKRPDPEREMEVEFMIKLKVFGRMKQVNQTRDEIDRYMKLHISPEAKVMTSRVKDTSKPLPGVPVGEKLNVDPEGIDRGDPRPNGQHP